MEKLTKVILKELNEWDLACSEDKTINIELAKALTNVVKNCNFKNITQQSELFCDCATNHGRYFDAISTTMRCNHCEKRAK